MKVESCILESQGARSLRVIPVQNGFMIKSTSTDSREDNKSPRGSFGSSTSLAGLSGKGVDPESYLRSNESGSGGNRRRWNVRRRQ